MTAVLPDTAPDGAGSALTDLAAAVTRCLTITREEARALDRAASTVGLPAITSAHAAARSAAWRADKAATMNAAADAAEAAVRFAAAGVPWGATAEAAVDAVRALTVRHLIGTGGFTPAHYDTLTAPWRAALGPLPGDLA